MSHNPHATTISEADLPLSDRQVEILHQSQAYLEATYPHPPSTPYSISSHAASRTSSSGLLHLDTSSMALLSAHFDSMMAHVRVQISQLEIQIAHSTAMQQETADLAMARADEEILRLQGYLKRMDELDNDFDEISSLRDIIKGNRQRIMMLAKQLEETEEDGAERRRERGRKKQTAAIPFHTSPCTLTTSATTAQIQKEHPQTLPVVAHPTPSTISRQQQQKPPLKLTDLKLTFAVLQPSPQIVKDTSSLRASSTPSIQTLHRTPHLGDSSTSSSPAPRQKFPELPRRSIFSQVLTSTSSDEDTISVPDFPSPNATTPSKSVDKTSPSATAHRRVTAASDLDEQFAEYLHHPPVHSKRRHRAVLFALEEGLRHPYAFTPDFIEEEAEITEPYGIQLVVAARTPSPAPVPKTTFRGVSHRRAQSQPVNSLSIAALHTPLPLRPTIAAAEPVAPDSIPAVVQKPIAITLIQAPVQKAMDIRHRTPTQSDTQTGTGRFPIKTPTVVMQERAVREHRKAEQKKREEMLHEKERKQQVAAEQEIRLIEEAERRRRDRRAAAAAAGNIPSTPAQCQKAQPQPYMSVDPHSRQPSTPQRARHVPTNSASGVPSSLGNGTKSALNGVDPAYTSLHKNAQSTAGSKDRFPHAFERWESLSAQWEGLTRHWIRRLEMNGAMLETDPLSKTLSRQVTDLSAAGGNLFHAVVELQRLRASSERKFQRWFHETRAELEKLREDKAQLEAALRDEQANRRETAAQVQNTETVNLLQRQLAEMKKELTISKEEARRAWEELGRREQQERERTLSLQHGHPTIVGGVQVVPMQTRGPGNMHASQMSYTPPPPSAAGQYPDYNDYVRDASGNPLLDADGQPIPLYQATGSPLSHPDNEDYDLPSTRGQYQYQSMTPSHSAAPPVSSPTSTAGIADGPLIPQTQAGGREGGVNTHQHPTRLSDVLEEEESRTTASQRSRS